MLYGFDSLKGVIHLNQTSLVPLYVFNPKNERKIIIYLFIFKMELVVGSQL